MSLQTARALPVSSEYSGNNNLHFTQNDRILDIDIEYAVYQASAVWARGLSLEGDYIYAYQISNNLDSNVDVSFFSVCVQDGAAVLDIGSTGSGVSPLFEYFTPSEDTPKSAEFCFVPLPGHSTLGIGETSSILYFTSNYSWVEAGFGAIQGGAVAGQIPSLPTPAPEPATIAFLGCGMLLAFFRQKGVSNSYQQHRAKSL